MTGESPVPSQPRALVAEPFAVSGGVPLPQESTVPQSEVASLVERTGPWIPADTGQPAAPAPPAPLLIAGRYELGPEIAHGGMGAVYRATDRVLGREVAVKLIRDDLIGTALAARFAEEARITARLQHPGIPPVHDLGQLPDGRPFLAMKLFRGRTLAAELATRAAQLAAWESPDDPSVQVLDLEDVRALDATRRESLAEELRRLTRIFEQVCQALAYAHSQRVIHRDLKPANIMVAAFGEIQVMDWGLAKQLREPATATTGQGVAPLGPETMPSDREASVEADLTRPGAVMGTFAYMPPEQARAETDVVDARADVFALGAILCQILTGRPPYLGRTAREVWQQAAAGELTAAVARLKQLGSFDFLEASLASLAIRCLAAVPSERPAHAGEVAVAVTAALTRSADEHRQAELNLMRTDVEIGYEKRSWFTSWLKAIGLLLLLGLIWLFGYGYRAMTVQEAEWTAKKEKDLQFLQKMTGQRSPRRKTNAALRRRMRRGKPIDLTRRREEIDLSAAEKVCACCGTVKIRIGQILSERLDYQPMALFVRELVRPTYACRVCESQGHDPQIARTMLPPEPIPKSGIGAGLLAHVIASKLVDHLPLHRQESILARHGWDMRRSTLCDHLKKCG